MRSIEGIINTGLLEGLRYCGDGVKWLNEKERKIIKDYIASALRAEGYIHKSEAPELYKIDYGKYNWDDKIVLKPENKAGE